MDFSKPVYSVPNICKVYFSFSGKSLAYNPLEPEFENTILSNGLIQETYFHKGSIQFSENSKQINAGTIYEQTLSISFNSSDANRSTRITTLEKANHIIIILTNGEKFIMGRNDFYQNKKPILNTTNNHIKTSAEFYCESIIPISKYIGNVLIGTPGIVPLDLMSM